MLQLPSFSNANNHSPNYQAKMRSFQFWTSASNRQTHSLGFSLFAPFSKSHAFLWKKILSTISCSQGWGKINNPISNKFSSSFHAYKPYWTNLNISQSYSPTTSLNSPNLEAFPLTSWSTCAAQLNFKLILTRQFSMSCSPFATLIKALKPNTTFPNYSIRLLLSILSAISRTNSSFQTQNHNLLNFFNSTSANQITARTFLLSQIVKSLISRILPLTQIILSSCHPSKANWRIELKGQ